MTSTLLIVDDHDMMREGLRYTFADTEIELIEASNGETALTIVFDQQVDVVLLDVEMPVLDGLAVLRQIKWQKPDLPVLMHSCHESLAYVGWSIELGASGYIVKSPDKATVIDAVRIALNGGNVWTQDQLRLARTGADLYF